MREEYLHQVGDYQDNLIPLMDRLEAENKWVTLSRDTLENYALGKSGLLFQFKVKWDVLTVKRHFF